MATLELLLANPNMPIAIPEIALSLAMWPFAIGLLCVDTLASQKSSTLKRGEGNEGEDACP